MFSCDGISDHASWNEVFHYWDTKLSCNEANNAHSYLLDPRKTECELLIKDLKSLLMIPTLIHIFMFDVICCSQHEKFAFRIEGGRGYGPLS